jgi:hypothetical protein
LVGVCPQLLSLWKVITIAIHVNRMAAQLEWNIEGGGGYVQWRKSTHDTSFRCLNIHDMTCKAQLIILNALT